MKIGIGAFKCLENGNALIEADRKRLRYYTLRSMIKTVTRLKHIQKRRNTRLIIYNLPEAVTPMNAQDIIRALNPDLKLQEGVIQTKYVFKRNRNTRNLVVEVNRKLAGNCCKIN